MGKDGTSNPRFSYRKENLTPFDGTNKYIFVWIYITDKTELKSSGSAIRVDVGNGTSDYYYKGYSISELSNGWNLLGGKISDMEVAGSPDIENLDFIRFYGETDNDADTIAHGNLKMDYWFVQGEGETNYKFVDYDVDLDNNRIIFNSAPYNGTNNIVVNYDYLTITELSLIQPLITGLTILWLIMIMFQETHLIGYMRISQDRI